jgi:hypothetical protein
MRSSTPRSARGPRSQLELVLSDRQTLKFSPRPLTARDAPAGNRVYRTIPSRIGELAFLDDPLKSPSPKKPRRQPPAPAPAIPAAESPPHPPENPVTEANVYLTFALLSTLTPQRISGILGRVPIFLRTLFTDGKLDSELVAKLSIQLVPLDLGNFVMNMAQETAFYNRIIRCSRLFDIEKVLRELIPIQRATVWLVTQNPQFLLSESLREVIPIQKSIVGYSILKGQDIRSDNPSFHPGFSVDFDIPLLRDYQSMILLPIISADHSPIGAIQCAGFYNQISERQIPCSEYYAEVITIVRNIAQKKWGNQHESLCLPRAAASILTQFEDTSLRKLVRRFCKFIEDSIPCDLAEIFDFDGTTDTLKRMNDGTQFNQTTGGISFCAVRESGPICLHHGAVDSRLNPQIDSLLANRSILSWSVRSSRFLYVITLRAKNKSPAFLPADFHFLQSFSPLLSAALDVSRFLETYTDKAMTQAKRRHIVEVTVAGLEKWANSRRNAWGILRETARHLFESDDCLVCQAGGIEIEYLPKGIRSAIEKCPAGQAYNARQIVIYEGGDEYPIGLYKRLQVRMRCVIAFPLRNEGKVVGAIELINPNCVLVDEFTTEAFASLAAMLFPDVIGVDGDPFE